MSWKLILAQKPVISSFPVDENTCSMTVNAKQSQSRPQNTTRSHCMGPYRPAKAGVAKLQQARFQLISNLVLSLPEVGSPGREGNKRAATIAPRNATRVELYLQPPCVSILVRKSRACVLDFTPSRRRLMLLAVFFFVIPGDRNQWPKMHDVRTDGKRIRKHSAGRYFVGNFFSVPFSGSELRNKRRWNRIDCTPEGITCHWKTRFTAELLPRFRLGSKVGGWAAWAWITVLQRGACNRWMIVVWCNFFC